MAAILGADIVGYSALMDGTEEATHRRVGAELDRVLREVERFHGRVFSVAGDGFMAEFPSTVEALKCGLRIQSETAKRSANLPREQQIVFRIGLNSGEILLERDRVGGTAVNVAARLEQMAEPGGLCLTREAFEQVRRAIAADYEFIGERRLKNIKAPVAIYRVGGAARGAWAGMPSFPSEVQRQARPTADFIEYRPSLAVLPFRTMQQDQLDAYFAEGMVDDIINALGSLRDLVVIARSSTQTFARAPLDVRRIHYELDVRYVLHGSVRRSTDALRISVELSEAPSGQVIWSERFDGKPDHLFDLQDHIAASVATAVAPHLRGRELSRALRKHPGNMTAYDLTLRALDQLNRMDEECLRRARELLSEATVLDPDYGPAYSRLASLHLRGIAQGWSKDVAADRILAESAARLAIDRDPNDPVGLAIYGHIQSYLRKDYKTGLEYLKQAQLVGPNCAWAWGYSSLTHGYLGDSAAAVENGERAVRLSPVGPDAFWFEHFLSQAYYLSGRYEDAIGWARISDVHNGGIAANQRVLMASLVALGDIEEARRMAAQVQRITPNFRLSAFSVATPLPETVKELFIDRLREAGLPD